MRTATAQSGRSGERSARRVAEKLARNAGVDLEDWIDEAVAEYASDLNVDPADLSERERLEAIEERVDRLARNAPPARRDEDEAPREPRRARRREPDRFDEAVARIERRPRPQPAATQAQDRLEAVVAEIEKRAELNERRTARAFESLATLAETRSGERDRLEDAISDIEKRSERSEDRTARALDSLAGLVEASAGDKERLQQAIAEVEARAEKTAQRTARALESLTGMVEARTADRGRLESAIERIGKRAEESEARTARALESLTHLVKTAPAPKPVEAPIRSAAPMRAPDDEETLRLASERIARRAAPARNDGDDDTFRLVAERLARRRPRQETAPVVTETPPAAKPESAYEDMQRQLRVLVEKVDALSRPSAPETAPVADPAVTRIERQLETLAERLNAPRPPAPDLGPLTDLARRVEAIRVTLERQAARPDGAELVAALAHLNDKLDRAVAAGAQSAPTLAALQGMVARLEEASQRPTTVSLDPRPLEDLGRRIDGVRGLVERQGGLAAKVDRIDATLGEMRQRPTDSKLETALARLSADVQTLARAPSGPQPIEDLSRRLDALRAVVDGQSGAGAQIERLERTLAELSHKVGAAVSRPMTLDSRPLDDLARRIDGVRPAMDAALRDLSAKVGEALARPTLDARTVDELGRRIEAVRSVAERGFAPHAAKLEAALADIRAKLDRPAAPVALDPRPIEELSRRIESVRESLDRPQTLGPQVERLETALGLMSEKLDRAQPAIDAQGLNSTLAAMTARLEAAFHSAAPAELGAEPIGALAAEIASVRETIERQAERFDANRLEEAFRDAVSKLERANLGADDFRTVATAIHALAGKVDSLSVASGAAREDLMERVVYALSDVAAKLDRAQPSLDAEGLHSTLAAMNARLDEAFRHAAPVATDHEPIEALSARVEAVRQQVERQSEQFDIGRLEEALRAVVGNVSVPDAGNSGAVLGAIQSLTAKVDGLGHTGVLEELVQDIAVRLDGMDRRLAARSGAAPETGDDGLAQVELAVRELSARIGEVRNVESGMRVLEDKLDDLADARLSGETPERSAQAIARALGERIGGGDPEALLGHLQDIHERLDGLAAARPSSVTMEQALSELTDELQSFRATRETMARGTSTLSEMRTEQAQLDRRLDARFSGLQDVLEKLVESIGRLDRAGADETPAPRLTTSAPSSRAALLDSIPERSAKLTRPLPPTAIEADPRPVDGAEAGKNAAMGAHIAAARRAANAAIADADRRDAKVAEKASSGLTGRALGMVNQHRLPVLLGAAGFLVAATGFAVLESRGHAPVHKSELDAPVAVSSAAPQEMDGVDTTPTASIPAPKVISAPEAAKVSTLPKPAPALVAALPSGVGSALAAAGSNGDVGAEIEIAQRFLEGRTVPRDPKSAAQWMQAAADAGNVFAQYRLGALYEKGVGVAHDLERARTLYTKAAEAGNARAMHNLAVLCAQDGGAGKPDYQAAVKWFEMAANYGVRDSQFNLGVLYGRGLGATQNLAQSWMWFSVAARQGDNDAARKRDEVALRMDGRVMADAQKRLDTFKPKTPDPAVNQAPAPPSATADAPQERTTGVKG